MQHPGKLHVIDEARPAGQQAFVFVAADAGVKVAADG
jgi:hypothetical protein